MTQRDETDPGLDVLSGQSAPPPSYWGGPGAQPPPPVAPPPGPPRRRGSTPGWLIGLVAVLAVVAVVLVVVAVRSYTGRSSSTTASSSEPVAGTPVSGAPLITAAPATSAPASTAPATSPASSSPASSSPVSSSPAASTSAAPTARQTAAKRVDALLGQSVAARAGVQPALTDIANCRTTQADVDALNKAAVTRLALIPQIAAADLTALTQGPELKSLLTSVWQMSASADNAYAQWGMSQKGCHKRAARDVHARQGDALSVQATKDKTSFVGVWTPIAKAQGLPVRSQSQI